MRKQRLLLFVAGPAILSACALIADLGERTLGDPNATGPEAGMRDTGSRTEDSEVPDGVEPPPPSYCDGIVLYASFDGKLTGDVGGESTFSRGGVTLSTQGKFGGALSLVRDASTSDTLQEGAALYFQATDAGNPWPDTVGSLSVWFRSAPEGRPQFPVLYRPVGSFPPDALLPTGLAFYLLHGDLDAASPADDDMGLYQNTAGNPDLHRVLTFPIGEVAPFLRAGDYNHYFTAWRNADAGPTAYMALNGGLGVVFDGSAPSYPDAASGGELPVPYRGFTSKVWTSPNAPIGLRLGGVGTNSPEGLIDDLVVWNRVLSFDEAAAVYTAGKAVGEVCKLR
jgi:hypothetical protein